MHLIDPYLLSQPVADDWDAAASAILAWHQQPDLMVSERCLADLMQHGAYAYVNPSDIQHTLRSAGIDFVGAKELAGCVARMLDRAIRLEAVCELVLCDGATLEPEALEQRNAGIGISTLSLGESIAACCHLFEEHEPCLASRPGEGIDVEQDFVLSAGILSATQSEMTEQRFIGSLHFRPPLSPVTAGALIADPRACIAAEFHQLPDSERVANPLRTFTIGSEFVESLRNIPLTDKLARVIVRQATRIVSGREHLASLGVHPHREKPGGTAPQIIRPDGFSAFRATVTKHGAGYRLLYWKRSADYELWSVRVESE